MIGHGAFADVLHHTESTVVKVFRRMVVTHDPPLYASDNDVVVRATCEEECADYERLAPYPELEKYAAKYFGRLSVGDVLNERGESVLRDYVSDCAFELELVPGNAQKLSTLSEDLLTRVDKVLDEFGNIGVRNSYDGSAFVRGTRAEFTLIDFGSMDAWSDLTDILADTGQLPPEIRERYRSS